MEVLDAILTRRSIRAYDDRPVPEELVERLLRAAMAAPSARNGQPWQFVVLTDRDMLAKAATINPYAGMAAQAPLAIVICADPRLEKSSGYWPVDCAAAAENMLLAAHGLGLGAVWTGIYPREERIEGFRRLLGLPAPVIAHCMIVVGYPAEQRAAEVRYHADRVHRDRWSS